MGIEAREMFTCMPTSNLDLKYGDCSRAFSTRISLPLGWTVTSISIHFDRVLKDSNYMYGGRDADNNYFGEIWILSLPSFTWTQVYSGQSPRCSHTCHLAGTRTMLTIGGVASETEFQGLPGISVTPCDWEVRSIGVLDISNITWGSVYSAEAPPYYVPDQVVSAIGGL